MSRFQRYVPYEGGDPLAAPADLRAVLAAIGDDVLAGSSPRRAVQEFLRRGASGLTGLDDLVRRARERRSQILRRANLDGTLRQVRDLLDRALLAERKQLARLIDDEARFAEMQIADLPSSTAQAVQSLSDYRWRSSQARADYDRIREMLGRELLEQRIAGMRETLANATEEDRRRVAEMMKSLNDLLDAHAAGADTDEQFGEFMQKYGHYFAPEQPADVDDLLDALARRAAAARRLRNSLTPQQRAELDALSEQAFGSSALKQQLDRLDAHLQLARPGEDWEGSARFRGENPMDLGEGTSALQEIAELEQLADQLAQQHPGAQLDDVDLDLVKQHLGGSAVADLRALAGLERTLHKRGFLDRGADGQLRLSPKAMRLLGEVALRDAVDRAAGRSGQRDTRKAGAMGEPTGSSRPWAFGDTEPWDVPRTVANAVLRTAVAPLVDTAVAPPVDTAAQPRPDGTAAVSLQVADVEVAETEQRTTAAVALLVDTSFSMVIEDRWVPMKRTALALNHLVATRFRGDHLQLIGFGRYAGELTASELASLPGTYEQGTNLHHALLLAGRHLRRYPDATPVLLVVTDGEPTAHLEPDGVAVFDYPPSPRTIAATVRELDQLARRGVRATIFRLGDDAGLARFVDRIARRIGGRVVVPDLDGLGAAVVGEYGRFKRRR